MRRAALVVACVLHTTTAKQADTLLLREDQCGDALFVAHWTHVPKAGGTALAGLRLFSEISPAHLWLGGDAW